MMMEILNQAHLVCIRLELFFANVISLPCYAGHAVAFEERRSHPYLWAGRRFTKPSVLPALKWDETIQ